MTVPDAVQAGSAGKGAPASHHHVIRLGARSSVFLAAASLLGIVAFGWPLFVSAHASQNAAHSADAPWLMVVLLPLLLAVVLGEIGEGSMDAKAIAVLGVLAACGAALRVPGPGVAGFEPMFFILVPAGRVMGRGFGFVLGALTMFVSALITGGVGPWLPFQMFCAAWMGFGAGCLPRASGKRELGLLAVYTAVTCLLYGTLMNLWFWPFGSGAATSVSFEPGAGLATNLHRFVVFDVTTSLGFDLPRAVTNAVLLLLLGRPLLAALRRASRRAAFDAPVTFVAGPVPPVTLPGRADPVDQDLRSDGRSEPGPDRWPGASLTGRGAVLPTHSPDP